MSLLGSKVIALLFHFHIMRTDFLIHFFMAELKEVLFVSDNLVTLQ